MQNLFLRMKENYNSSQGGGKDKKNYSEIQGWEKTHLLKVLEECRKPGKGILKKLDYYFLPGSLLRREFNYQFFRNDLEAHSPKEFGITNEEKKKLRGKMQEVYGIENIRNAAYIIGTVITLFALR